MQKTRLVDDRQRHSEFQNVPHVTHSEGTCADTCSRPSDSFRKSHMALYLSF